MTGTQTTQANTTPSKTTSTPLDEIDAAGRRWHVVVVKPLVTDRPKAIAALRDRGYQVLAPLCRELVTSKAGQVTERVRPMFGRYILAGGLPGQEARKLALVPSVQHVSLDGRRRALVLNHRAVGALVERMRDGEDGVIDLLPRAPVAAVTTPVEQAPAPRYRSGQTIRVTEGAFAGFSGLFVADEGERLRVLLGLFGGTTEATVPASAVKAAE